jgi:hypothetical protein
MFQGEGWSQTALPDDEFIALYAVTCEDRGDTPLPITVALLTAIRARMAEVCWDRGQDARARKLFEEAMNSDEKRYGPINFKKDAGVLTRMMSRLVDAELRAGRVQAALEMAAAFGRLGFLTPDLSSGDEYLNMLVRRAIATAQEAVPVPQSAPPPNLAP